MIKRCAICGKEFSSPPSDNKRACSAECSRVLRSRSHKGVSNAWSDESRVRLRNRGRSSNLALGTPAARKSPVSGPFETNRNAKEWVLVSPDGKVYEARNLSLWLREHADMLDGTPEQARCGLAQVKRSTEGKTKRTVGSWKGWKVV